MSREAKEVAKTAVDAADPNPVTSAERTSASKLGRRKLALVVTSTLLGLGAVMGAVRTSGYPDPPKKLLSLAPWQHLVVTLVARRIAAPDGPDAPTTDEVDVAGFVDGYVANMPPKMREDVGGLIGVVEHLAPLRAGFARRFSNLTDAEQDASLTWLERADGLLAGAFDGLRALIFMGYYRDPRTWGLLGYEGPTLGRERERERESTLGRAAEGTLDGGPNDASDVGVNEAGRP